MKMKRFIIQSITQGKHLLLNFFYSIQYQQCSMCCCSVRCW